MNQIKNPTQHSMTRRSAAHDYTRPGIYHITLHVADGLGRPLGAVVGDLSAPDGTAAAPRIALSPIGQMVEHELLHSIRAHYPMIAIDAHIIMPEHLHFIIQVQDDLISAQGKKVPLGQLIAGFKKGCNRLFWKMIGHAADYCGGAGSEGEAGSWNAAGNWNAASSEGEAGSDGATYCGGKTAAHTAPEFILPPAPGLIIPPAGALPGALDAGLDAASLAAGLPGALGAAGLPGALGAAGLPGALDAAGLDAALGAAGLDAALGAAGLPGVLGAAGLDAALGAASLPSGGLPASGSVPGGFPAGYKVPSNSRTSRCPLFDPGYCDVMPVDAEQLATQRQYIAANPRCRLLRQQLHLRPERGGISTALSPAALRGYLQRECPPHLVTADALASLESRLLLSPDGRITCDTFGDRALLARRLLPVVCHRKDASRFAAHRSRCLAEAARGSVLISARIAKGEQAIIDEALRRGFPVALIADNGFPDRYHPSADHLDLCAAGRLIIITPWQFHYRSKDDAISVPFCKAMNCLAQALARRKDTWWQQQ